MSEELPVAVWSGEIMGIRVHVLEDGRRIIDVEDIDKLFQTIATDDSFDVPAFVEAFSRCGSAPTGLAGTASKGV